MRAPACCSAPALLSRLAAALACSPWPAQQQARTARSPRSCPCRCRAPGSCKGAGAGAGEPPECGQQAGRGGLQGADPAHLNPPSLITQLHAALCAGPLPTHPPVALLRDVQGMVHDSGHDAPPAEVQRGRGRGRGALASNGSKRGAAAPAARPAPPPARRPLSSPAALPACAHHSCSTITAGALASPTT